MGLEDGSPHEDLQAIISQPTFPRLLRHTLLAVSRVLGLGDWIPHSHWTTTATFRSRIFLSVRVTGQLHLHVHSHYSSSSSSRLLLGWSVLRCLCRVQSSVVASIIPRHHDVLHLLILHYDMSACSGLSMFPRIVRRERLSSR
jgi:hypothetical protein